MKLTAILCAGILLFAVLICGCTTTPQESNALPETPDLIGNWTGTMTAYEYGDGYTNYDGAIMTLSVTEQQDRIFSGEFFYTDQNGNAIWETAACVLSASSLKISIASVWCAWKGPLKKK